MQRATRFVLGLSYLFSVLFGIFPYVYNYERQTIRTSCCLTVYSIAMNLFTLSSTVLPMFSMAVVLVMVPQPLNAQVEVVTMLGKVLALVVMILMNWLHRRKFMDAIHELHSIKRTHFQHLKVDPKLQRQHDNSILMKFFLALVMDASLYLGSMSAIWAQLNLTLLWGITVTALMNVLVNAFINHYCFAIVHINLHYNILNAELARILAEARSTRGKRPGFFVNHCCRLADELDEVAMAYERLHKWADRIKSLYKIAGICTDINFYLQNIAYIFYVYAYFRHRKENIPVASTWGISCFVVRMLAFLGDSFWFSFAMLDMLEMFEVSARIMRQGLPLHALDERLEQSIANFCLQIAYNPMELSIMGLYKFNKPMLFGILSSMVMTLTVLIQYEYKNY